MADGRIVQSLTCSKCGDTKHISEFHRCSKWARGYAYKCKTCVKEYHLAHPEIAAASEARRKAVRAANKQPPIWQRNVISSIKRCPRCRITKQFSEFYRRTASKDGRDTKCKACCQRYEAEHRDQRNAQGRRYALRHPDRRKDQYKRSRQKRRAARNKEMRAWRKRNKDRISEYEKGYHERRLSLRRARYAANADRARKRSSQWKKANRDKAELSRKLRRARKRGAPGSYTLAEAEALLVSQNYRCANPHCRTDLRIARGCLDHIVALVNGGSNFIYNMQWLCVPCNSRKTTFSQEVWLEREAKRSV